MQKFTLQLDGESYESIAFEFLDWDTKVLGLPCARICEMTLLRTAQTQASAIYLPLVQEFKRLKLQYVTVRLPQREWARIHSLEASGFRLLDGIIDFEHDLPICGHIKLDTSFQLRQATEADAAAVANLSSSTFTSTRFHNDPVLTRAVANNVFSEWAKNSCLGIAADSVWLAEQRFRPVGLITCKINGDAGRIGLVGVDKDFAGRGIGKALVTKAAEWFSANKCKSVFVQTQTDNAAAIRLYGHMGFSPASTYFTLRWSPSERATQI